MRFTVAIVGSGPTGLTLANLLGRAGVRTLLIERHPTTVTEPRAVSIDDESLRTMQAAGAIEAVLREVVPGYGSHYYSPGGRCFARVEPTGTPFGYPRRNAFRQPVLEQQLRDNLARWASIETRFGCTLAGFEDTGDAVRLDLAGEQAVCDYLVGCDGASSRVRESLGIRLGGTTFDERWLIVDLENNGNDVTHTKVFCDVRRPCITLPGPHRTRRFEFKLHPDEHEEDLLRPAKVAELLATHGADPAATIRRQVVYHFHARVADRWSKGRVFLAGDAAHLTPPFAGQGMNSGIRDAQNLAWKLTSVARGVAGPGLLDSYAIERRNHVWAMIRLALRMGRVMSPPSRLAGWATRMAFTALRVWPPASDYVLQMKYKPKPHFAAGFVLPRGAVLPELVGRLFPQPKVMRAQGTRVLLDEVLGDSFCLLAGSAAVLDGLNHAVWDKLDVKRVGVLPLASPSPSGAGRDEGGQAGKDVADHLLPTISPGRTRREVVTAVDGAFPRIGDAILLLRPDHYVAGAFAPGEADAAARAIQALLASTWRSRVPVAAPARELERHAS